MRLALKIMFKSYKFFEFQFQANLVNHELFLNGLLSGYFRKIL